MGIKSNTFCLYERKKNTKYSTIITLTKSEWFVLFLHVEAELIDPGRGYLVRVWPGTPSRTQSAQPPRLWIGEVILFFPVLIK